MDIDLSGTLIFVVFHVKTKAKNQREKRPSVGFLEAIQKLGG